MQIIFSNKKKDLAHNTSFRSSLLRMPYTFNSKNQTEVKIIQEFDKNNMPTINAELLRCFRLWLVDNDIREKQQKLKNERYNKRLSNSKEDTKKNYVWIEKLLQTPIPCFRRYCLYRIVVPYLVNIKELEHNEYFNILKKWLEKCDRLSRITFDMEFEIKG
jgi:hypothetical protein